MSASIRWGVPVLEDADTVGTAIGDATASAVGVSFADGAGSAIGDATCSGAGEAITSGAAAAAPRSLLAFWASGATSPQAVNEDGAGSATGDSTAAGGGSMWFDGDGTATGDATATAFSLDDTQAQAAPRGPLGFWMGGAKAGRDESNQDGAGSAIGDATCSAEGTILADCAGNATGDATCDGGLSILADCAGSATGDATCDGVGPDVADCAGSAIGDATCSGGIDGLLDCAGSATGDATCQGVIEDATAPVVVVTPPVVDAGGVGEVFRGVWRNRPGYPKPKPKKQKRLDDLEEMIAELRSRIEEVPDEATAEDIYQRAIRVSQALANQPDPSLRAIDNQIVLLRAAINEIDDEEAILLLAA